MPTVLLSGMRVSGRLDDGSMQFQEWVTLEWLVDDYYNLHTAYRTGIGPPNDFGMLTTRIEPDGNHGMKIRGHDFDRFYFMEIDSQFPYWFTPVVPDAVVFNMIDSDSGDQFLFALNSGARALFADFEAMKATFSFWSANWAWPVLDFVPVSQLPRSRIIDEDVFIETTFGTVSVDFGIGQDVIYVRDGNDRAAGGADDDRLVSLSGAGTELWGGQGNDIIKFKNDAEGRADGGAGDDRLIGSDGANWMYGGEGSDILIGLGGQDVLSGDEGDDFVYGGLGNDSLTGGVGNDLLRGNRGDDTVYAGDGDDRLFGGANNDDLNGENGRDFLLGEAGNDRLDGGAGNDNLTGGAGADVFYFLDTVSPSYTHGYDRILDFTPGEDRIELFSTGVRSFDDIRAISTDMADGVRIKFDPGSVLFLNGVSLVDLSASDFLFV